MSKQRYTPEFKDEAARQIVDRGYSVADVSERLGVSAHSLYKWVKAIKPDKTEESRFRPMASRWGARAIDFAVRKIRRQFGSMQP